MKNDKSPAQHMLFARYCKETAAIPATGATSRSVDEMTDTVLFGTFWMTLEDGSREIFTYRLTCDQDGSQDSIIVDRSSEIDHWDQHWGPGGPNDGYAPSTRVIVDHHFYVLGDDKGFGGIRGFAGRRFDIEFFDGRRVTTHDLWSGGIIPPKWRERWPDNAVFAEQEESRE